MGFARNWTVIQTATDAKLSRQSVDDIFHRLRERLFHHGLVKFDFGNTDEPHPVRFVVNQTHRGAPERHHDLHAAELVHRGLHTVNLKGFEELSAANPAHVKKAIRLHLTRPGGYRRCSRHRAGNVAAGTLTVTARCVARPRVVTGDAKYIGGQDQALTTDYGSDRFSGGWVTD